MYIYIISSFRGYNTGEGGHYYSLKTIVKKISEKNQVLIINIGDFEAPALKDWDGEKLFLNANSGLKNVIKKINSIISGNNVKIIHTFDFRSSLYGRILSYINKVPMVNSKAGGPLPQRYYPNVRNQTVFHLDDYKYFQKNKSNVHLELISGRVNFLINNERKEINRLKNIYDDCEYRVLRISRFTELHEDSIIQSINFTKKLNLLGVYSKLVIIGEIKSNEVFEKIKSIASSETTILIDKNFTYNASDFNVCADIVIGAGRSFMEGAASGAIMMAPVKNSEYPALVEGNNVEYFEASNFSNRTKKNEIIDPDRDVVSYINKIQSDRDELVEFMRERYINVYSVESAVNSYEKLYQEITEEYNRESFVDIIIQYFYLKSIVVYKKLNKKF